MKHSRKGIQLVEVSLAASLCGTVVLMLLGLVRANTSRTQQNLETTTARMMLADLSELLMGETLDSLLDLSQRNGSARLDALIQGRIDAMPPLARERFAAEAHPLLGHCSVQLEANCGNILGLYRLTLSVSQGRDKKRLVRLFRPQARVVPAPG